MKTVSIVDAKYLSGYKIKLTFSDGVSRIVDFSPFLSTHSHPQYDKYKKQTLFKKYKLEMGNIVWGKNWDLVFPVYELYRGEI